MTKKQMTIVEEIIELDQDLLKVLARRAKLLQKTRRPKKEGMGNDSISSEKSIRLAWEENSARFSKDPRLTRQMFTLIQDISFIPQQDAEDKSSFNLAPSFKPVDANIDGPASLKHTRIWMTLAAATGTNCRLTGASTADPIQELLKALSQTGASIAYDNGDVVCKTGGKLTFADKVIYAGHDVTNFYLLALLAAGQTGTLKFTSGSTLKDADLTSFGNFMPKLGARMAHVVPRSTGLPVRIESSGVVPDEISVPADLPDEALTALLIAAPTWNIKVSINMSAHANAEACMTEALDFLTQCNVQTEGNATTLSFQPAALDIPAAPKLPLDAAVSSTLLAFAGFSRGSVALKGSWPKGSAEHASALTLLRSAGINVEMNATEISAQYTQDIKSSAPLKTQGLATELYPLAVALSCLRANLSGEGVTLPTPPAGMDMRIIETFAAQANIMLEEDKLFPGVDVPSTEAWTSPDAHWTMAFALISFIKRQIGLTNPGTTGDLMPSFWTFFNGLPCPTMTRRPKEDNGDGNDGKPKRRRIIAGE